jgi:GNAT superfamily N-acetyltransferase
MLHIRPLTQSDLPAALRLSTQAGWNQLDADWLRLLRLFPEQCLGGCVEDQLVATATLATYDGRLGWVGMILVDEAHRSRGYGGAMFDAILSLAERLGIATLGLDATELGQPLYSARGFRSFGAINRWVGQASRCPEGVGRCVIPVENDWPDILALDRESTGMNRSSLLRMIAGEPGGIVARILREAGRLVGFALARPGRTAVQIGPVISRSSQAAGLIIDAVRHDLSQSGIACPILIDIPAGSLLEPLVSARGLTIKRRLVCMFRPQAMSELLSPSYAAAIGFELG